MITLTTVRAIFFQFEVRCFLFIMSHQAPGKIKVNQVQNKDPRRPRSWLKTGMAFAMTQAMTQSKTMMPYQLPSDLKDFSFITLVFRHMRT